MQDQATSLVGLPLGWILTVIGILASSIAKLQDDVERLAKGCGHPECLWKGRRGNTKGWIRALIQNKNPYRGPSLIHSREQFVAVFCCSVNIWKERRVVDVHYIERLQTLNSI